MIALALVTLAAFAVIWVVLILVFWTEEFILDAMAMAARAIGFIAATIAVVAGLGFGLLYFYTWLKGQGL